MHRIPLVALLVSACPAPPAVAQDAAALFQANCAACHLLDRKHVGPSLVEIAALYRDKPTEFVAWCRQPEQKRQGVVQMPSMAHLGEQRLRLLHGHILAVTEGKTEVVVAGADRFRASPSMRKRPQVLRIFMPDAGPAAIAVAVDDRWSYCFDAGACRLRYVWTGDFVDGWPVWRGNGDALARIVGDVMLRETRSPLPLDADAPRRFLGYRLEAGLPTFRYRVGEVEVQERIARAPGAPGLVRTFELRDPPADLRLRFTPSERVAYESAFGSFADGVVFTPAPQHRSRFSIVMREVAR